MSGLLDKAKKASLVVTRRATLAQTTQLAPIKTMRVHTKRVWAVAFFKDGRRIVTPSKNKTLQIWDVETRTLVGDPFEGHSDHVYSVAVSPDDRRFASGGETGVIIIWDVDRKQMLFKLEKHKKNTFRRCVSLPMERDSQAGRWIKQSEYGIWRLALPSQNFRVAGECFVSPSAPMGYD
jgi:WD40 repeat protein